MFNLIFFLKNAYFYYSKHNFEGVLEATFVSGLTNVSFGLIVRWQETHKAGAGQCLWSPSDEGYGPEKAASWGEKERTRWHLVRVPVSISQSWWKTVFPPMTIHPANKVPFTVKKHNVFFPKLLDFPNKKQITQHLFKIKTKWFMKRCLAF